ncbi:hypothetical protein AGR4C_pa50019 [Agrobacterium tumefaciens str. Kerr 14]|uniref:Uncharacterized protein n=1 Tax=Agrobacterium tumefaciens str. Kerr 14 TaxID=1183424 RepID=A0A1S7SA99_AGRTU|nr:hypothetical protein [Agrobacterium tumefaciens]CUX65421.1 hypothetical protein AGR4C_pa50019 [Agrobacterium tumefaciens str. Kerr 14]
MENPTNELVTLMESATISQDRQVRLKDAKQGEVLFCLPTDNDPAVWDALPPQKFVEKHGSVTYEDLEHILILVKDQNGNYAPSTLFDKTITRPDGKARAYKDRVRMATDKLREWGIPVNFNPKRVQHGTWRKDDKDIPKYKLEGERQFFNTPGGTRSQQFEYKNAVTTGASAPEMLLHNGHEGVLVFRKSSDGLDSIEAVKSHYGWSKLQLKSTGNFFHDVDYINSRSDDWNSAEHRFAGYLNEGHTKGLGDVMVEVGGRMFEAKFVLKHQPHSEHAQKLLHGPNKQNEEIRINVRDVHNNNTYVPIELASVTSPGHLSQIATKIGLHKGKWAETEVNDSGTKKLTQQALRNLFNKYTYFPSVMVQSGSILYPLSDPKVTAHGPEFPKIYPRDKIFVATVGKKGWQIGAFRNAASLTNERIAPGALQALQERTAASPTLSRFAPRSSKAAGKQVASEVAYETPAPTPPHPSRFENRVPPLPSHQFSTGAASNTAQFFNYTAESFQAPQDSKGTSASQARSEIISRRNSEVRMVNGGD